MFDMMNKNSEFTDVECGEHLQDCLHLRGLVKEARVSAEKAKNFAVKLTHQIITSDDTTRLQECINQVSNSLEQAVISTTLSLSTLENIQNIRKEKVELNIKQDIEELEPLEDTDEVYVQPEYLQPDEFDDLNEEEIKTDLNEGLSADDNNTEGAYSCNLCQYSTTEARYLTYHRKRKHEPKRFRCEDCDYLSFQIREMKLHMKRQHNRDKVEYVCQAENPDIRRYLCQHCSFSNTSAEALQAHMANKHLPCKPEEKEIETEETEKDEEKEEYKCTRCTYVTTNKEYFNDHINGEMKYLKCPWCDLHVTKIRWLTIHYKNHHGIRVPEENSYDWYKCPDCETKFPTTDKLLLHVTDFHKNAPLFHCPECDYSGKSMLNLKNHMEDHNIATYYCSKCSHVAKSPFRLQKHMNTVHGSGSLCDDCGSTFATNDSLRQHKRSCINYLKKGITHQRKQFRTRDLSMKKCMRCDFTTPSFVKLKAHFMEEHKGSDGNQIEQKCPLCDHVSTTFSNLHYHYISQHKEKVHKCDECDYEATSPCMLRIHKENKHAHKRFSCKMCDMTFKSKVSIRKHVLLKHTANQPVLRCREPGCEFKANRPDKIKIHVEKVHLGIRWPCDQCEYIGPYKGDLTRHMKKVHNIFPEGCLMSCDMCEFTSQKTSTMAAHKKKVHNVESG